MQATWLEDEDGFPRTASARLGWIVLFVVITSGTAFLCLHLYLCLWVLKKARSFRPLVAFVIMLLCFLADALISSPEPLAIALDLFSVAAYITAALLLRADIRSYFRRSQGWEPVINPIYTCFLSAIYINHSLVPTSPAPSSLITLNIPPSADSTKIAS